MMKRFSILLAYVFFPFLSLTIYAQGNKPPAGSLFIIGGGNRSDSMMKQLVKTADLRANDYIVILPMASAEPDAGFALISQQLSKHTNARMRNFDFAKYSDNKTWVDSLAGARLIYILGGDQNRFMKTVLNTPIYNAIHKAYQQGATIAGTSAGAAVMSRYMITGRQLRDTVYKETFDKLWSNNVEFAEGLSLLPGVIIDQHFVKRSRYSRLLSALAEKPDHICIGIDEGTAIIVHNQQATVTGVSQVLRFDHADGNSRTATGLLKFQNIQLGVFVAGDIISLKPNN